MTGERLVGHRLPWSRLSALAREAALSHAILLSGPPSVGKTTLALALAELLLDGGGWPGPLVTHPDLWLEDGPAERIGIDRVRAGGRGEERSLQDFLALRSYAGGRRVAVLARADRLTVEAANCILHTVEEPPANSHLILCAAHPERLPDTLVSRCQRTALAPVPGPAITSWLTETHGVLAEIAELTGRVSGGRPGRALHLATAPGALELEVRALDRFLAAAGTGLAGAIETADALAPPTGSEGRERSLVQLAVWAEFLRDAICHAEGAGELSTWTAYRPAAERWAALPAGRLVDMLGRCVEAADELERNAGSRLRYEVLFLDLFASPGPPPPALEGWTPPAMPVITGGGRRGPPRRGSGSPRERSTGAARALPGGGGGAP